MRVPRVSFRELQVRQAVVHVQQVTTALEAPGHVQLPQQAVTALLDRLHLVPSAAA